MYWNDYLATCMKKKKDIIIPKTGEKIAVFPMVYTRKITICGYEHERGEIAFWTDSVKNVNKSNYPSYFGEKTYVIRSTVEGSNTFGPRKKDLFIVDSDIVSSYIDNRDMKNNGFIINSTIRFSTIETEELFIQNSIVKDCIFRGTSNLNPTKPDAKIILSGLKLINVTFKNEKTICYYNEYKDISPVRAKNKIPILDIDIYSQQDFSFGMCEIKQKPKPEECWATIIMFSPNKKTPYSIWIPAMSYPIECLKISDCIREFLDIMMSTEVDTKNLVVNYLMEQNGIEKEASKVVAQTQQDEMIAYSDFVGVVFFLMFAEENERRKYEKYLLSKSSIDITTRKIVGFKDRFRLKKYKNNEGIDFPIL